MAGGDRGLYKSTDGGETWKQILGGGEYTGVNEVHMDPRDPDVLYAGNIAAYRSSDGGRSWENIYRCYIRAVWVDPVKATPAMRGSEVIISPTSPAPGRSWNASSGMPA